MQEINSEASLREAILRLEARRTYEGAMLKEEFRTTLEGLKPMNLVKSAFNELVTSSDSGPNIISTVAGLTTGYLGKVLVGSVIKSPFKRILGNAAMFGITNFVARNPEKVKSLGKAFFKMVRGKSRDRIISI
ncbi:MAG: hypothetical protein WCK09_20120 [Bacteroidota bacterium]